MYVFFVRAEGADDVMLSTIEIRTIALKIEEELYAVFQETGHKYKAKYRSLIFNIKDSRNQVLFMTSLMIIITFSYSINPFPTRYDYSRILPSLRDTTAVVVCIQVHIALAYVIEIPVCLKHFADLNKQEIDLAHAHLKMKLDPIYDEKTRLKQRKLKRRMKM